MYICWIMGWTLPDLRQLEADEYMGLIKLIRDGKIRPPMVM